MGGVFCVPVGSGALVPIEARKTDVHDGWNLGWSPDSRRIVYSLAGKVKVHGIDNRESQEIADGRDPTWSPDGAWIAFRSDDDRSVLISAGTEKQRVFANVRRLLRSL